VGVTWPSSNNKSSSFSSLSFNIIYDKSASTCSSKLPNTLFSLLDTSRSWGATYSLLLNMSIWKLISYLTILSETASISSISSYTNYGDSGASSPSSGSSYSGDCNSLMYT